MAVVVAACEETWRILPAAALITSSSITALRFLLSWVSISGGNVGGALESDVASGAASPAGLKSAGRRHIHDISMSCVCCVL